MTRNEMMEISALIVSDFNCESLAGYLKNDQREPRVTCHVAPYGQVVQVISDKSLSCWRDPVDLLLIWTTPERQLSAFKTCRDNPLKPDLHLITEVDNFSRLVEQSVRRARTVLVPSWVMASAYRGLGLIELKHECGLANMLLRANLRLVDNLKGLPNVYVLNAQRWVELVGASRAHDPTLWYLAKAGLGLEVMKRAVQDIKAALRALAGQTRKLIAVDLDDTLWGGILGDVGWEGIRLGGHDPVGESLVDFQLGLKALKNRGIMLGIVSKNEEAFALEAIARHPEMVLRADDFSGWRINWKDKADNLQELARELNIGLDSIVYIDDNPAERLRVRGALPEVLVPEWPRDKLRYLAALWELDCFDMQALTHEDAQRTEFFTAERQRQATRKEAATLNDWLKNLETTVTVDPMSPANLARASQLLNKTNQMNLATRRLTEREFWDWSQVAGNGVWTFRVSDRFGDAGLTGIVGLTQEGETAVMVDFVLSCRVMGRRIEETMVHVAARMAKQRGMSQLCAVYRPTPRNKPCLDFLEERSELKRFESKDQYSRSLDNLPPLPDCVRLIINQE